MTVRMILFAPSVLLIIFPSTALLAAEWYVDGAVAQSGNGTSWATAFGSIQEGIDAASDGDTVIVELGSYYENIHFNGKNIILRSKDPLDSSVVESTKIVGGQAGAVVTFSGTEDPTCTLSGFTISDGSAEIGGGILGGAPVNRTHAAIQNNVITANSANISGGGLAYCDGTIEGNTISGNSSGDNGGGLFNCHGTIFKNTITGNSAYRKGGGLYGASGAVHDNMISQNSATEGGGLAYCSNVVRHNTITGNSAEVGGGLYRASGTVQDNVISENSVADRGSGIAYGGALAFCHGTIQKNVITDNSAGWVTRSGHDYGGALYRCDGMIQDNTIRDNYAENSGGGLYECNGIVRNNIITSNSAGEGGGFHSCDGIVVSNTISRNSGFFGGGGLAFCAATIRNNTIVGNEATVEAVPGGGLWACDGVIRNNLIACNLAGMGGGLSGCDGTIESNTIADNLAWGLFEGAVGGGLWDCHGTVQNCVIWGNMAVWLLGDVGVDELRFSSEPRYSCIRGWTGGGEGNIGLDPLFVDGDGPDDDPYSYEDNNYRLLRLETVMSPCIDAGKNELWMTYASDLDGNRRIFCGGATCITGSVRVDMGAYEYGSYPFQVVKLSALPGGILLEWISQEEETYGVFSCSSLYPRASWTHVATVRSGGETTTWTDRDATSPQKFYRIEIGY